MFMKHQFKRVLTGILIVVCLAGNGPTVANAEVSSSLVTYSYHKTKEAATTCAQRLVNEYGCESVQYALLDQGKIVVSGQAGRYKRGSDTKLNARHMYGIGSISKLFTTVALLQLVQEGRISLDAPVYYFVRDFKMADERYRDITVRMLLNHSSGLMGSAGQNVMLLGDGDSYSHDHFLQGLASQRLKAAPGEFSVYSNDGFTLAEILIERVSGMSYSRYLQRNISAPLGLSSTKTPRDAFNMHQLVKTYYPELDAPLSFEAFNAIGAGGIYSTAEELCRFSQIFLRPVQGFLNQGSIDATKAAECEQGIWPEGGDTTITYGLGWDSVGAYPFSEYGIQALVKGGDTYFYHSSLIVLPEYEMSVAVLSSDGSSTYNQMVGQRLLLTALQEKGIISSISSDKTFQEPAPGIVPEELKEYSGLYATMQGLLKVEVGKDRIYVSNPYLTDTAPGEFIYSYQGKFMVAEGKNYSDLQFVKESNGNIYLLNQSYSDMPGLGQTANFLYVAQKVEENTIPWEVQSIWNLRNGKRYFIVNEKYSSLVYPISSVIIELGNIGIIPGYFGNSTIIDEDMSQTRLQIPGVYGRDLLDYQFEKDGMLEYLHAGDSIYLAEEDIGFLSSDRASTYRIGKKGYASWYKIPGRLAGKRITIQVPDHSSFCVYSQYGDCINDYYISKDNTVILPESGYLVFTGEDGETFRVKRQ